MPDWVLVLEAAKEWGVPPWQIETEASQQWWERWRLMREEIGRLERKGQSGDGLAAS